MPSNPLYLRNDLRIHGPMVIETLWPACSHSFTDLWAVYPVLQRWVPADRIEAAVAADGAFIWYLLGETLAHNGLRWGSRTSCGSWGGWFHHWTSQSVAVALTERSSDAAWLWSLSLPSNTEAKQVSTSRCQGWAIPQYRCPETTQRTMERDPKVAWLSLSLTQITTTTLVIKTKVWPKSNPWGHFGR